MKLNKKGFTLIELLGVIVILLSISVIAITSISSAIERNKVKQNEAKKSVIVSYAKLYYEEHKNSLNNQGEYICISVVEDLNLEDSELTDAYGDKFNGFVKYTKDKFEYVDTCS